MSKIRVLSRPTQNYQVAEFEIIEDIDFADEDANERVKALQEYVHNMANRQLNMMINEPDKPSNTQEQEQDQEIII